jgi:hypothetical protein
VKQQKLITPAIEGRIRSVNENGAGKEKTN